MSLLYVFVNIQLNIISNMWIKKIFICNHTHVKFSNWKTGIIKNKLFLSNSPSINCHKRVIIPKIFPIMRIYNCIIHNASWKNYFARILDQINSNSDHSVNAFKALGWLNFPYSGGNCGIKNSLITLIWKIFYLLPSRFSSRYILSSKKNIISKLKQLWNCFTKCKTAVLI